MVYSREFDYTSSLSDFQLFFPLENVSLADHKPLQDKGMGITLPGIKIPAGAEPEPLSPASGEVNSSAFTEKLLGAGSLVHKAGNLLSWPHGVIGGRTL